MLRYICACGWKWLSKAPNNGGPSARTQLWVCPLSLSFFEDKRGLLRQPRLAQWRMDNSTALSQLQEPSSSARTRRQARPKGEAASFHGQRVIEVVADYCDRIKILKITAWRSTSHKVNKYSFSNFTLSYQGFWHQRYSLYYTSFYVISTTQTTIYLFVIFAIVYIVNCQWKVNIN